MKKIIVPTDFSSAANNAARYALHLARGTKTSLLLCNAIKVPAEAPMAAQMAWPLEYYPSVKKEVTRELKNLAEKLVQEEETETNPQSYHPIVEYSSEVGSVINLVRNLIGDEERNLVVMGISGAGGLSRIFGGSHTREMIEKASFGILLIPSKIQFNGIGKIAFATDLNTADVQVIYTLAELARPFNAEILVVHITDETFDNEERQHTLNSFLSEITCRANYPKISYRHIQSIDVEHGLDWLTEHEHIDMLTMVHRPYDFFDNLFKQSYTQKMARHIHIPLLVLPANTFYASNKNGNKTAIIKEARQNA